MLLPITHLLHKEIRSNFSSLNITNSEMDFFVFNTQKKDSFYGNIIKQENYNMQLNCYNY